MKRVCSGSLPRMLKREVSKVVLNRRADDDDDDDGVVHRVSEWTDVCFCSVF